MHPELDRYIGGAREFKVIVESLTHTQARILCYHSNCMFQTFQNSSAKTLFEQIISLSFATSQLHRGPYICPNGIQPLILCKLRRHHHPVSGGADDFML